MAGERYMTTDHERIRKWVEERDGTPSTVRSTHTEDDPGLIRLDFPDYSGERSLEAISWDEWFDKFDEKNLVLLYQETLAAGGPSNFNKLISRETAEENDSARWVDGETRRSAPRASGRASGGRRSDRGDGETKRVNLNTATAEELDSVFGIGPATAEKIVRYRDQELGGEFHSEHDITHIPGIGDKTAESILRSARVR